MLSFSTILACPNLMSCYCNSENPGYKLNENTKQLNLLPKDIWGPVQNLTFKASCFHLVMHGVFSREYKTHTCMYTKQNTFRTLH